MNEYLKPSSEVLSEYDSSENGLSLSESAKQAAKISGFRKGEIYKKLLGE